MTPDPAVQPQGPPRLRWVGVAFLIGGVVCDIAAFAGIFEVGMFRLRATARANAIIVEHVPDDSLGTRFHDVLEFAAPGKTLRVESRGPFGILWGWSVDRDGVVPPGHGLREKVLVRYSPYHPEIARPAAFENQLAAPLYLLFLGAVITPIGIFLCSRGLVPTAVVASSNESSQPPAPKPLTQSELEDDMAGRLGLSEVELNDKGGGRFEGAGRAFDGVEVRLDVMQTERRLNWKAKWDGETRSGGRSEGEASGSISH